MPDAGWRTTDPRLEVCVGKVGAPKVGIVEAGTAQGRALEAAAPQVGPVQVSPVQGGEPEVHSRQDQRLCMYPERLRIQPMHLQVILLGVPCAHPPSVAMTACTSTRRRRTGDGRVPDATNCT